MSSDPNAPTNPEDGPPQAEPGEGINRRQFVIRLSAYGLTAVAASVALTRGVARAQDVSRDAEPPMSGTLEATAEIDAGEGSSSYHLIGSIVYETYENPKLPPGDWGMRILKFSLSGKRLSGPELGVVRLDLAGPTDGVSPKDGTYAVVGPLTYSDEVQGKLQAEAKWTGSLNNETDELKSLRIEGMVRDGGGKLARPIIGVGIKIPIGKMTDDEDE